MVNCKVQRGTCAVAQSYTLLYRGFAIRQVWRPPGASAMATPCRIQFGDTADYKSALREFAHDAFRVCAKLLAGYRNWNGE